MVKETIFLKRGSSWGSSWALSPQCMGTSPFHSCSATSSLISHQPPRDPNVDVSHRTNPTSPGSPYGPSWLGMRSVPSVIHTARPQLLRALFASLCSSPVALMRVCPSPLTCPPLPHQCFPSFRGCLKSCPPHRPATTPSVLGEDSDRWHFLS